MLISKNAVGIVMLILSLLGLNVVESQVVEFVSSITTIISFALMIWNQYDRKDVKSFFFKK